MFSRTHAQEPSPEETAALYLAADEARWLAEEHGLSSYWEVARVLSEALPKAIADSLEFCWASAAVVRQEAEGDTGFYRRLQCHAASLRQDHPEVHAAMDGLVQRTREARACAVAHAA